MSQSKPKVTIRERVSRIADRLLDPEGVRQQEFERELAKLNQSRPK